MEGKGGWMGLIIKQGTSTPESTVGALNAGARASTHREETLHTSAATLERETAAKLKGEIKGDHRGVTKGTSVRDQVSTAPMRP